MSVNNRPISESIQDFVDLPINVFEGVPDQVEVSDGLLAFCQEIWVCFNTGNYENIADTKSGDLSIEDVIFNRTASSEQLKNLVKNEIDYNTNWSSEYRYEIEVKFIAAEIRDVVVIDVIVFDTDNTPFKQRFLFE